MRRTCLIALGLATLCGCQGMQGESPQPPPPTRAQAYQTLPPDAHGNTQPAQERNGKAVELIGRGDLTGAEKELKEALSQDLFFGPAHNNLGLVYFRQNKYYLAAWEFQYAAKLMPNKSEPANNLGMVYEAVGKPDDATKYYETALKLEPESAEAIGNLARLYVGENRCDTRTRELLSEIVFRDLRPDWVAWARERLALMRKAETTETRVEKSQ